MMRFNFALLLCATMSMTLLPLDAGDPCHRNTFETEMYETACKAGGQTAAKDAAKKFMKDHGIKSCNQCHTKLAPNYELKADGLEQFNKAGGKVVEAKGVIKPLPQKPPVKFDSRPGQ